MSSKDVVARRRPLVQSIRQAGGRCFIRGMPDDAGRKRVESFVRRVLESAGPAKAKSLARASLTAYLATFQDSPAGTGSKKSKKSTAAPSTSTPKPRRVRGKSQLFTYNWDFLASNLPDGTPPARDAAHLWDMWQSWEAEAQVRLCVHRRTSKLEESLLSDCDGRVHIHWKVDLEHSVDLPDVEPFAFHGIWPDVRSTWEPAASTSKARGRNWELASNRAHFYCWCPKKGSLHEDTNWAPFTDYRVHGQWIEDLWGDDKLTHDAYHQLSLRIRKGHAARKRDLQAVQADEREDWVDTQIKAVNEAQTILKTEFRQFAEVEVWEDSFLIVDFRWTILALVADSASGKSTFGESLFENPFVITVEEAVQLDLKAFCAEKHDGIVLDNVNSWGQILLWRALLQARNAKSRGGQSATNMYSYVQYLYGVPIVATLDLDTPDKHYVDPASDRRSRWLLKNCVFVSLPAGETFFKARVGPKPEIENTFSLFAKTVKRRRARIAAGKP